MLKAKRNYESITLGYYDQQAKEYVSDTQEIDFSEMQNKFLSYIPLSGRILDFGCGSGRDTRYFLQRGFLVDAIDGSREMCKQASECAEMVVKQMLFQDLNCKDTYAGIWACASILHLPQQELQDVLKKIAEALEEDGILYASFKYGKDEGYNAGRYFNNMSEEKLQNMLKEIPAFEIQEMWITSDVRKGREEEKWLNFILIKRCQSLK